jgi:acetoin:2,6-dichlorophenolindophenol oxidoreductase subunit beta
MPSIRFAQALHDAIVEEMRRDPTVIVLGEDVRCGLMGVTGGLLEEFGPQRVFDTPLSEAGFTGLAIGAAIRGLRPIVEYQISSLPYVAMDQLVDQAAKLRYMTGGQIRIPMVVRVAMSGAAGSLAAQHSDHNYPMLAHMGLKVAMPANPADAKGLLKAAIRDDDPVIVYEDAKCLSMRGEVPDGEHAVPLGAAAVGREGTDVTVVAVGHLVEESLKAAARLDKEGISIEVVDPRTILPLDIGTILRSVAKTSRLVIADDSNSFCGFAAEVAAQIAHLGFDHLKTPIIRCVRPTLPVPFSPRLEQRVLPAEGQIVQAVRVAIRARTQRVS